MMGVITRDNRSNEEGLLSKEDLHENLRARKSHLSEVDRRSLPNPRLIELIDT